METGANLVLTAVATKLLSADKLPSLPYMTLLDKYLLGCTYLLIFLVFECVMLHKYCPEEHKEVIDIWAGYSLLGAWVLFNLPLFWSIFFCCTPCRCRWKP